MHFDGDETSFCKENEFKGAIQSMLSKMTARYRAIVHEWFERELLTESLMIPADRTLTKIFGDARERAAAYFAHSLWQAIKRI